MLDGFREIGDGLIGVSVFNAFPDAVLEVPFKNDLSRLMHGLFHRVYLDKNILARNILVNHLVDSFNLPRYPVQSFMQILRVHTLPHNAILNPPRVPVKAARGRVSYLTFFGRGGILRYG